MKFLFTLVVLTFVFAVNALKAQVNSFLVKTKPATSLNSADHSRTSEGKARHSCGVRTFSTSESPLLVIDGILHEFTELQKLNPNDIASIEILKEGATALIGCRPARGVIIITTKSASVKKFIIKDFLSGEKVPSATIWLTSGNDTVKFIADENGELVTDKLKPGLEYEITVSSAGYKSLTTTGKGKEQEILLERDIKENENVVVIAYPTIRCRSYCCGGVYTRLQSDKINVAKPEETGNAKPLYPNPVQRNNVFNLELESRQNEVIQLSIISLNGSLVSLQSQKISKGLNRISVITDVKWSAGIYVIQLRNAKGTVIKQEKLVVQ